jgi:transglutaminase-like putative cysteine protease
MRIKVRHETRYTYSQPVASALQLLRMTPRPHDGQFVRRWRVEVDTDARLDKSEDAFGNVTHLVFLSGPLTEVTIRSDGEVETADTGGVIRGAMERQPARLFLRDTALTQPSPEIQSLAAACMASGGGDPLSALHAITHTLHTQMTFKIGSTTTTTTAADALTARSGVCQDYAHIFVAAARSLGIPARYVGGYYLRTDTIAQEAGHAWAEAYVDGLGWVGFDAAQGLSVTDRYVRIAIGCDFLDASPVRGARTGGHDEALAVAISIEQGRAMTQE